MHVWACTGVALPKVHLPNDPNNSSQSLLHGAYIESKRMPICVIPGTMLILWLFYHEVPHPKGSSRKDLVDQVQRAYDLKQPLGEDRLVSNDAETARSYVSFDTITILSSINWNVDGDSFLTFLRSESIPHVNDKYKCMAPFCQWAFGHWNTENGTNTGEKQWHQRRRTHSYHESDPEHE